MPSLTALIRPDNVFRVVEEREQEPGVVTSTVEQYVKVIYTQGRADPERLVQMKRIAAAMDVTPGTATSMVKHLARHGLVRYEPRHGCRLTDRGTDLAVRMLRRHRLIETFLERVLGYDWSEVHAEAEQLEHSVSDLFVERIDGLLNYPATDPHGDPIPTQSGQIRSRVSVPLDTLTEGVFFTVVRILDDSPEFLDLMKRTQLLPGNRFRLRAVDPTAGTLVVYGPFEPAYEKAEWKAPAASDNEAAAGKPGGGQVPAGGASREPGSVSGGEAAGERGFGVELTEPATAGYATLAINLGAKILVRADERAGQPGG